MQDLTDLKVDYARPNAPMVAKDVYVALLVDRASLNDFYSQDVVSVAGAKLSLVQAMYLRDWLNQVEEYLIGVEVSGG